MGGVEGAGRSKFGFRGKFYWEVSFWKVWWGQREFWFREFLGRFESEYWLEVSPYK